MANWPNSYEFGYWLANSAGRGGAGLGRDAGNNSDMLKNLQNRADDLTERLLIAELEMRRSRTLERKLEAYQEFGQTVNRIDTLRRDLEAFGQAESKESLLTGLDRKVSQVMRSPAYRVAEWFDRYYQVRWYVEQGATLAGQC
jgi:hypothetical protein